MAADIRDAQIDDIPAIMRVMTGAFDPAFGEGWSDSQCAVTFELPHYRWRVSDEGGAVTGFLLARTLSGESELMLLAVLPARQGSGLGGRLLDDWMATCSAAGIGELMLEVRATNSAQRLYRSRGFAEVARRAGYYRGREGDRHDAITMKKNATSSTVDCRPPD